MLRLAMTSKLMSQSFIDSYFFKEKFFSFIKAEILMLRFYETFEFSLKTIIPSYLNML